MNHYPSARSQFCRKVPALAFAISAAYIRPVSTTVMEAKKPKACPSYGCPILPQDVYYDESIKGTLTGLRGKKRVDVSAEDLKGLESSGGKGMATLTLVGYKGGPLEAQINQDRSFCVSPYKIGDTQKDRS